MFRYIIIRNFQSIRELTIRDLEKGVTAIWGDNEIGKGSFRKAVKSLMTDIPGIYLKKYLRRGEHSIYIEAGIFDDYVVKRSFGKEKYFILFKGDEIVSEDADYIRDFFNLYIDAQSKQIMNIRQPEDPLIGVYTSPRENTKILQQALGTVELSESVESAKADWKELNGRREALLENIKNKESELRSIPSTVIDTSDVENILEEDYQTICEIEELIEMSAFIENQPEVELPDFDAVAGEHELLLLEQIEQYLHSVAELAPQEELHSQLSSQLPIISAELQELAQEVEILTLIDDLYQQIKILDIEEAKLSTLSEHVKNVEELVIEAQFLMELEGHLQFCMEARKASENYREALAEFKNVTEKRDEFMRTTRFCPVVADSNYCPFGTDTTQLIQV